MPYAGEERGLLKDNTKSFEILNSKVIFDNYTKYSGTAQSAEWYADNNNDENEKKMHFQFPEDHISKHFKIYVDNQEKQSESIVAGMTKGVVTDDKKVLVAALLNDVIKKDNEVTKHVKQIKINAQDELVKDNNGKVEVETNVGTLKNILAAQKSVYLSFKEKALDIYNLNGVYNVLSRRKSKIVERIKKSQEMILEECKSPEFKQKLRDILNLGGKDDELTAAHNDLIANLEKKQAAELQNFEKPLNAKLGEMSIGIDADANRINALMLLFKNEEAKKQLRIQAIPTKNTVIGVDEALAGEFNEVNMAKDDLRGKTKSSRGRDISITRAADNSIVCAIEWGNLDAAWSYFRSRQVKDEDIASVVAILLGNGAKSITLAFSATDDKDGKELARKGFIAALRAGLDPKNINVTVNGVKQDYEKDFKNAEGMDDAIKAGAEIKKDRETAFKQDATDLEDEVMEGIEDDSPVNAAAQVDANIAGGAQLKEALKKAVGERQDPVNVPPAAPGPAVVPANNPLVIKQ